jgi:hypothetical protein
MHPVLLHCSWITDCSYSNSLYINVSYNYILLYSLTCSYSVFKIAVIWWCLHYLSLKCLGTIVLYFLQTSDITVVSPDSWSFVTGRHWQTVLFEGAVWCTVCYHVVFVTAFEGRVTDKHKGMQSSRRVIHQCIRLVPAVVSANIVCGCGEVEMSYVLFLLQYKCTLCKEIS